MFVLDEADQLCGDRDGRKSVFEILVENEILPENYGFNHRNFNNGDPIHLNDIEPALTDSEYWKKWFTQPIHFEGASMAKFAKLAFKMY